MQNDYDPMIYDVFRETANQLGGVYIAHWSESGDPGLPVLGVDRGIDGAGL